MTRKDYFLLSRALNRAYATARSEDKPGIRLAASEISDMLAYHSTAFDASQFMYDVTRDTFRSEHARISLPK